MMEDDTFNLKWGWLHSAIYETISYQYGMNLANEGANLFKMKDFYISNIFGIITMI